MPHSASGRGLTRSLKAAAAVVTIAFGLWQAGTNARKPVERGPEVGEALHAYRKLRIDLPASGPIGFVPVSNNPTLNAGNHFVAQYALAPRVVLAMVDDEVSFVVSGINASAATDTDPQLAGYELAGIRDMGIRIFRKRTSRE